MKHARQILSLFMMLSLGSNSYGQSVNSADISNLRRPRPVAYALGAGDVLGVFIEGVLGEVGSSPPVQIPPAGSDLGPSMGFPVVVRENGTISLPLVEPIPVSGLTLPQAEERVRAFFLGGNEQNAPIVKANSRIIVTLQRKRTVSVTVIRQDESGSFYGDRGQFGRGPVSSRSDRSARATVIQLPAYQNDVLNALVETGGIPGLNAQPDARILRPGLRSPTESYPRYSAQGRYEPNRDLAEFPRSGVSYLPNSMTYQAGVESRVPIRQSQTALCETCPPARPSSILKDGDIVIIEAKPTEVYYTGGLLAGGEYPLPRDKSLNILEAVALAGGPIASTNHNAGFFPRLPPTELVIVRNRPGCCYSNIRVDLNRAVNDPSQRLLVAPGDILILKYKPGEQVGNFGIDAVTTYGVLRAFR